MEAPRRPIHYLGVAIRGFIMGMADVVPGVSGGTMAFILGIYEELIAGLRALGRPHFWRLLMRGRLREASASAGLLFLVSVLVGILLAVFTLARAVTWLLENEPSLVWGLFFGLVLASIVVVGRRMKRWNVATLAIAFLAAVAAFFLVGAVPVQTPEDLWFIFLSGVIAICAMILPGISGAFILVLLSKYEYILGAVNDRDITVLAVFVLGALVGIVSFAQVLGWLFRRFHDLTVAALIGLMAGSLRKIWPWKDGIDTPDETAALPSLTVDGSFNLEIVWVPLLMVAGIAVVLVIDWYGRRKERVPAGEEPARHAR